MGRGKRKVCRKLPHFYSGFFSACLHRYFVTFQGTRRFFAAQDKNATTSVLVIPPPSSLLATLQVMGKTLQQNRTRGSAYFTSVHCAQLCMRANRRSYTERQSHGGGRGRARRDNSQNAITLSALPPLHHFPPSFPHMSSWFLLRIKSSAFFSFFGGSCRFFKGAYRGAAVTSVAVLRITTFLVRAVCLLLLLFSSNLFLLRTPLVVPFFSLAQCVYVCVCV